MDRRDCTSASACVGVGRGSVASITSDEETSLFSFRGNCLPMIIVPMKDAMIAIERDWVEGTPCPPIVTFELKIDGCLRRRVNESRNSG